MFGEKLAAALETYYRVKDVVKTEEEMAKDFIDLDIKALIIGHDAESNTGVEKVDNDYPAGLVRKYPCMRNALS